MRTACGQGMYPCPFYLAESRGCTGFYDIREFNRQLLKNWDEDMQLVIENDGVVKLLYCSY